MTPLNPREVPLTMPRAPLPGQERMPIQPASPSQPGFPPSSPSQPGAPPGGALVPFGGMTTSFFPTMEAPQVGPTALSAAPDATSLWHALRRRLRTALVVASIGAVAIAALAIEVIPAPFVAAGLVKATTQAAAAEGQDIRTYISGIPVQIRSQKVLEAALNEDKVQHLAIAADKKAALDFLSRELKIDSPPDASLEYLRVKLTGDNPVEIQTLLNAVLDAFVKSMSKQDHTKTSRATEELRAKREEAQHKLTDKRKHLKDLEVRLDLHDPKTRELNYLSAQKELEGKRQEVFKQDLKVLEIANQITTLTTRKDKLRDEKLPDSVIDSYLKDDPAYKGYQRELVRLDTLIEQTAQRVVPEKVEFYTGSYKRAKLDIYAQIGALRRIKLPDVRAEIAADLQTEKSIKEQELKSAQQLLDTLKDHERKSERKMDALAQVNVPEQVEQLRRDIKADQETIDDLQKKISLLQHSPALDQRVNVVSWAGIPDARDRSRQVKLAGAAGGGTFVLLLVGIALLEFRSRKINTSEDVVKGLGFNVLGTVPALPASARGQAKGQLSERDVHWQQVLTESIDAIRTMMLHVTRPERQQVIMIASAESGEGKTSIATHLAASLARAWRKTLLIDGDLRNPSAHKVFDMPPEPGLSEVLRGEVPITDAIRPSAVGRLWMMPAGHWDPQAIQALAQDGVRSLFDQLKEQYDYIIVDSSPLLPVTDGLLLAQHMDAVVFSIMQDVSRAPAIYAAQQKLTNLGIRILGAVVSGGAAEHGASRYPAKQPARR